MIDHVVSGGQAGVDRAALDAALELGVPCGGWCPKGRKAEDGVIPAHYPLQETPSDEYEQRTEWNVREADGTLILAIGPLTGGTALTASIARRLQKPLLVVNLATEPDLPSIRAWLSRQRIHALNVAGPRESAQPGISQRARVVLEALLRSR